MRTVRVTKGVQRRRALVAMLFVAGLTFAPRAAEASERTFWEATGVGIGTGLTNILYFPAKLIYGVAGTTVGGVAWLVTLGDVDAAQGIWSSTLGGTWVVTPAMLEGREPIEFNGRIPLHVGTESSGQEGASHDPLDPNDPYAGSGDWR